ncbi:MAG: PASTA domain-containing protein [Actinomycetota bacterium]
MDRLMDWKGKVLRRRYRLDERIAVGRTVEVFRAFDLLEEKEVAVKLPLPHLLSDRDFCDAFRAAAHRATRLSHPSLVKVFDYGIEEGRPFVAMEIVEEKTLQELLEAGKRMKPVGTLYFALEMGKLLAYLQEQGVVHGSLDERHVFIFRGRKVKVSDAGFPLLLGGGASTHPISQDARRDIQDLGYLLYRSLTGRGKTEATEDIRSGKLKWDAQVPARVQRLVQNCLDSQGSGGFPSAREMMRETVSTLREEQPMVAISETVPAEAPPGTLETEQAAVPAHIPIPHFKRWQVWTGVALLVVLAICVGVWILSSVITGSKVEVPNLVNMSTEEAAKVAGERDLGVLVVGQEYDVDIKANYVISQDPEVGVMVNRKTVIRVLESLGPLTVPNLIGLSLNDARVVLESRGFKVGEVVYRDVPGYSDNRVVETDPPYGSKLSSGDSVDLVVSGGGTGQ